MKIPQLLAPFLALFVATLFGVTPGRLNTELHIALILPIFLLLISWNALGKAVSFFLAPLPKSSKVSSSIQFLFALLNLLFLAAMTIGLIAYIHPRIDQTGFRLTLSLLLLAVAQYLATKRKIFSLLPALAGISAAVTSYLGFVVLSGAAWVWQGFVISLSIACCISAYEISRNWSQIGAVRTAKILGVLLFLTPLLTFTLCVLYALSSHYFVIIALIPLCGRVVLQAARAAKTPRDLQNRDVRELPNNTLGIYYIYLLVVALLGLLH